MRPVRGSCACGTCSVKTTEIPKARLICHCTICQAFTGRAYSDVVLVPAYRATMENEDQISFRKYKRFHLPPPNLDRGRCRKCDRPVVETVGFGLAKVLFIPSVNFAQPELLPRPGAQVFYEHHRSDVADGIPKREGYIPSQIAILRLILKSI